MSAGFCGACCILYCWDMNLETVKFFVLVVLLDQNIFQILSIQF